MRLPCAPRRIFDWRALCACSSDQKRGGHPVTVELNGIAHLQLTVNDPERCIPFWERLCQFLEMKTLLKAEEMVYCVGSRTGILFR